MVSPNTISMNNTANNAISSGTVPAGSGNERVSEKRPIQTAEVKETDRSQAKETVNQEEKKSLKKEDLWDDIVSVSEDGDTVRVSEEGNEELSDSKIGGVESREDARAASKYQERQDINAPEIRQQRTRVEEDRKESIREAEENRRKDRESAMKVVEQDTKRAEEIREVQIEAADNEAEEDKAAETEAVEAAAENSPAKQAAAQTTGTYAGISDMQLEQMYLTGAISRYDYETEIQAREAREEEQRSETQSLANESSKLNEEKQRVERVGEAIEKATSDRASDTLSAQQRLDVIEKLSDTGNEKARREEEQGRLWDYQLLT